MTASGNGNDRTLSKGASNAGEGRGEDGTAGDGAMKREGFDERLAALLDDDVPEAERREMERAASADPAAVRALAEMRAIREALREAGPAKAPDGFEDAVIERMRRTREREVVVRIERRRERVLLFVQAASVAAVLFVYAALFGATRIHDVQPRWGEAAATEPAGHAPDAGAGVERIRGGRDYLVSTRPCVSTGTPRAATVPRSSAPRSYGQASTSKSSPGYVTFAKRA